MLDQILTVCGVTFLAMVSPGPDMVVVLRNTVAGGRAAGLETSGGVLIGNLVHMAYCLAGIGLLISTSIVAFSALKYAGAAYLIYLGIQSLRAGSGESLSAGSGATPRRRRRWFVQGVVNNALNPKGALFYLGVFTVVITPETSPDGKALLAASMMAVSASFWLVFVCTLDRPMFRRAIERSQVAVNRVFGVLLVALGVRVAVTD